MTTGRHSQEPNGKPPRMEIDVSTFHAASLHGSGVGGPPELLGQRGRIDDYELLDAIDSGGMGIVFLARHALKPQEGKVALKRIHTRFAGDCKAEARFIGEIKALQTLQHRYIVEILDVSNRPEEPYYVMPFYERGSVAKLISEQGPLEWEDARRLGGQLAAALSHAHAQGLRHGDVKPVNLLLEDDGQAIRLSDFGLARDFSRGAVVDALHQQVRCGTAPYMSPLMVEGKKEVTTQADIYMFGATLYELLTGRPPYQADPELDHNARTLEIFQKILAGPPEPIARLRPDVPTWLIRIVEKAMEHDRERRYVDMDTIVRDLNAAGDAQPGRRRWPTVVAVLTITCLMVLGLWHIKDRGRSADTDASREIRSIHVPGVRGWNGALPGDWDGDGEIDLYLPQDDRLVVVSRGGETLAEHRVGEDRDGALGLGLVDDLDGDGRDEAFLSWSHDTSMFIDVVTQHRFGITRFTAEGTVISDAVGAIHPSSLVPVALHDLDGDGRPELVAHLHAGVQKVPRGVCCFDTETSELLWSLSTAVNLEETVIGDVTADGEPDIVLGSYAHGNGVVLDDGTSDDHSYVYLLDRHGGLQWIREFGGEFSSARPALVDLDEDGRLDILVTVTAKHEFRPEDDEFGHIERLDAQGQTLDSYEIATELLAMRAARLAPEGPVQLVAADRLGRIHLVNADLSVARHVDLPRHENRDLMTRIQAIEDLDGDGRREIVLTTWEIERRIAPVSGLGTVTFTYNHAVIVLDADLNTVARHTLYEMSKRLRGTKVVPSDVDGDGRQELLLLTDEALLIYTAR